MRFRTIQDIIFPTKKTDRKNLFSTASTIPSKLKTTSWFTKKKFSVRVNRSKIIFQKKIPGTMSPLTVDGKSRNYPHSRQLFFWFFSKNQLKILENHCKSPYSFTTALARSARYFPPIFLDFSGFAAEIIFFWNYLPLQSTKNRRKNGDTPPQSTKFSSRK